MYSIPKEKWLIGALKKNSQSNRIMDIRHELVFKDPDSLDP